MPEHSATVMQLDDILIEDYADNHDALEKGVLWNQVSINKKKGDIVRRVCYQSMRIMSVKRARDI